jgi:hypothetical protein
MRIRGSKEMWEHAFKDENVELVRMGAVKLPHRINIVWRIEPHRWNLRNHYKGMSRVDNLMRDFYRVK